MVPTRSEAVKRLRLTEHQTDTYDRWDEVRTHIELELRQIERAISGDATQIESSSESVYASADHLRHELLPQLKQIANALQEQEYRETEERLPR